MTAVVAPSPEVGCNSQEISIWEDLFILLQIIDYIATTKSLGRIGVRGMGEVHTYDIPCIHPVVFLFVCCFFFCSLTCINDWLLTSITIIQKTRKTSHLLTSFCTLFFTNSKSCVRGWRVLYVLSMFAKCSDKLKPYLCRHLEVCSSIEAENKYSAMANSALLNLQKTLKYGGRENLPSKEEIDKIMVRCPLKI